MALGCQRVLSAGFLSVEAESVEAKHLADITAVMRKRESQRPTLLDLWSDREYTSRA